MRPVLPDDLFAAARVLLIVPPQARQALARRLVHEAQIADNYRLATGRPHPRLGGGTLMAAALANDPEPEGRIDDPAFHACLIAVLQALPVKPAPVEA